MSNLPKFELNLNEDSEISFKLNIEGNSSETPQFRFIMTEMGSERGWVFPVSKEDDEIVTVSIPSLKETFSPEQKYHGKLEVLLGNVLVVPTEMVVEFVKPIQVEATPVVVKSASQVTKEQRKHPKKNKEKEAKNEEVSIEDNEDNSINIEDYLLDVDKKTNKETAESQIELDEETKTVFQSVVFNGQSQGQKPSYREEPNQMQSEHISPPLKTEKLEEHPMSKAAISVKESLKKAFLEALNSEPVVENQQKQKTSAKELAENKTLEEAKALLLAAARDKKPTQKKQEPNIPSVEKRPKSLKDLFKNDF